MRVLVDSSVWGDFFNAFDSPQALALERLIEGEEDICTCGVVVSEVFQGFRKDETSGKLAELFRALLFLEPSGIAPYFRAAEVYRALRKRGITVRSTIDCLIAVLADENDCYLLARDKDLRDIVASGVVDVPLWPG